MYAIGRCLLAGDRRRFARQNHLELVTRIFRTPLDMPSLSAQKFLLGFAHALKAEAGIGGLHESGNAVVAQVADGAFVGVVDFLVRRELVGLDVKSHFLIGVAEGHALRSEAVDLFNGEHEVVTRIVEDMLVDTHTRHDVGGHTEAGEQLIEGWQEDFLDFLQVAEIAARQIVHNHHHLRWQSL